jgi:2-keto-4-pentenoate hydratase/2-oxohepta-3-ene-1,7-dioic acid hydratase in catechol pathway
MRLVTLRNAGRAHAGLRIGDEYLDLGACASALPFTRLIPASVKGILEGGDDALALVRSANEQVAPNAGMADRLRECGALVPEGVAKFFAPVPDPYLVLSCGRNYRSHLSEMKGGAKSPQAAAALTKAQPTGFIKNSGAVIGPGQEIVLPAKYPAMVDWEAEFCAVIGRACHGVTIDDALEHVAGYTMINDVSARDFIPEPGPNGQVSLTNDQSELNLHGKQFPTFCPMGPALVTKDEIRDPDDTHFELLVNGQLMQSANTGDVFFNIPALIAYFSQFYRLRPGDVISTGSPAGVGFARNPRVFLKAGDRVEIRCDEIGAFVNTVAAPR